MKKYAPAIVAILFAALTAAAAALTDGRVDQVEWVQIAIQGTTVAGVWLVPAIPAWPNLKTGIAVVLAMENGLIAVITDGLTTAEIVNLVLAGLGVVALRLTPPPVISLTSASGYAGVRRTPGL